MGLRRMLQEALREKAQVSTLQPKLKLEFRDLDCLTTIEEVTEAIRKALPNCETDPKEILTKANSRQLRMALVEINEHYALELLKTVRIKVGWVNSRIRKRLEVTSSRNIRVEGHGSEEGFVWVRCEAMTFFSCYLTPNESIQQFRTKVDALEDAIFNTQGEVIVGVDFNAKAIEWCVPHPDSRGRYILEMAARTELIVLNEREVTTFRRLGYSETIPDVSFASEALAPRIIDWKVSENFTGSDRQTITFTVYGRPEARCRCSPISGGWNFGKLDAERFCRALPPVCRLIAGSEASACDASVPRKAPRHCRRAAYWWTAEIAELRRRCLRLRRIAQRAGNREEANIRSAEHREAKKSLRWAINESKARHWKDMVSDVDSDPWGLGYKLVTRRLGAMKPPAILELARLQRIIEIRVSGRSAMAGNSGPRLRKRFESYGKNKQTIDDDRHGFARLDSASDSPGSGEYIEIDSLDLLTSVET
ncbi:hypothetical protein Trydic_g6680 [Trypoxylus dichotomus]